MDEKRVAKSIGEDFHASAAAGDNRFINRNEITVNITQLKEA